MAFPIPAFSDISKLPNDLLNKDFYHLNAAALEVKSQTPNGVNFKVTGRTSHESATTGALEAKYSDKSNGITLTQGWSTANSLDTKIEFQDIATKGLKAELLGGLIPSSSKKSARLNFIYQQAHFHTRAFLDLVNTSATVDAVIGNEGFMAGGELAYDVQKASISKYSAAVGYKGKDYVAAVTATNNLSVFAASYYHKVNPKVEAGAKAVWDSKAPSGNVGLEVATKFRNDALSFTKAKINDRGIAAVSYNTLLRPGVTLGLGVLFDTTKLDQATHKVGTSITFEG